MASEQPSDTHPRPLSPHLQVYRWQISSTLSILHRFTGIALAVGTLVLVYWLVAAALGPAAYADAQSLIGSIVGQILLIGWVWSLFYHLGNGIRHLIWDAGYGYELPTMAATGWTVVAASVVLTVIVFAIGWSI
jgi:succinate dehydrogenase / fumarate reductase cytochrome b subunit